MDGAMQGPAVPRDEEAIRRKRTAAIGLADDVLIRVRHALWHHAHAGPTEQITPERADALIDEIAGARGAIAEWRPESD